jgi:hypothetical protein
MHTRDLSDRGNELTKLRRFLLRISRTVALLLGEYFRFSGGFHLRRLRRYHTVLIGWIHRRISGRLDYFRLLNSCFRTSRIRTGVERNFTAHCIALAVGSNFVIVRWSASGISASNNEMRFFVGSHVTVRSLQLPHRRKLVGAKLLRTGRDGSHHGLIRYCLSAATEKV